MITLIVMAGNLGVLKTMWRSLLRAIQNYFVSYVSKYYLPSYRKKKYAGLTLNYVSLNKNPNSKMSGYY